MNKEELKKKIEVQEQGLSVFERTDRRIFRALYFGTRNPVFDVLMPVLSVAANRGVLHSIVGIALIIVGTQLDDNGFYARAGILVMAATAVAGILAEGTIKFYWRRKRPFQVMEDVAAHVSKKRVEKRPSFPSGHSAGYLAATTVIALNFPHYGWIAVVVGLLGAYSRVYNGVHFPSDITAGSILGALCAIAINHFVPMHIPPVF